MGDGQRAGRGRWALAGWLLLLLGLGCGLMAMHGMRAAGSPIDMTGTPVISMGHMEGAKHEQPGRPVHDDEHPGGQVCLGLLVLAFALVLLTMALGRSTRFCGLPPRHAPFGGSSGGRSPPALGILELAVLRL